MMLERRALDAQARVVVKQYPAGGGAPIEIEIDALAADAARLAARRDGRLVGAALARREGEALTLEIHEPDVGAPGSVPIVAALLASAFQSVPGASFALVPDPAGAPGLVPFVTEARAIGAARFGVVERAVFHALPALWRDAGAHVLYPTIRSRLGPADRPPPLRPPKPAGVMYRRFVPGLGELSLRPIDRRKDLALFHGWMNQKRVAFFWDMAQSETELDAYLAAQEADAHTIGVVAALDGEPGAYLEFYWAKEDRLGAHYEAEDFDRGWHALVGEPRFLGRARTLALFRSLTHYLFLDDPRTMRIVGEPRASHVKILSYCEDVAYDRVKEFDFPHKRAMLVMCRRERFFAEVSL